MSPAGSARAAATERCWVSAEIRELRLSGGKVVKTPLLVPSFSSKGFGRIGPEGGSANSPKGTKGQIRSEISDVLEYFAVDQLSESFLVSAYDLRAGLLSAGDSWGKSAWSAGSLSRPEVLFLDSGGYEVRLGSDGGELVQDPGEPIIDWDGDRYAEFLDELPTAAQNVAAVSWDLPGVAYDEQISSAQRMLGGRELAPIVLLKPPQGKRTHDFSQLEASGKDLAAFAAVGVTEHELGEKLLDRIEAVMELRDLLERAGLKAPIHVFGALDPLYVPLYFAAGADIFDGLTWLRYSYWQGLSLHREQGGLLHGLTTQREDVRRRAILTENLGILEQLKVQLQRFAGDEDWTIFSNRLINTEDSGLGESLREAYLSASARRPDK